MRNGSQIEAKRRISRGAARENSFSYHFDPENLPHWCFDDCPDNELLACWHYEYLRDCSSVIRKVRQWRKTVIPYHGTPEEYLEEICLGHPYERTILEWPESPYLEIAPGVRRLHLFIQNAHGKNISNWLKIERRQKLAAQIKDGTVAVFPVQDWSASDTEILAQFKHWLKTARPKGIAIRENRGKRNSQRKLRTGLKALGAWRLSQVMSQNDVIRFAIEHGKRLYRNQPDLSKQLTRTARYLAWLDKTEVDS